MIRLNKHFLLKFNHGVEIGAFLAYCGHYERTKDMELYNVLVDELRHRQTLKDILYSYNDGPSRYIDGFFRKLGSTIKFFCKVSPLWSLDWIARLMELFAVVNYRKLAVMYPEHAKTFNEMADCEDRHSRMF